MPDGIDDGSVHDLQTVSTIFFANNSAESYVFHDAIKALRL